MDCHEAFPDELVESYVRGRLDEAAMQSFEEHYFGCPDCLERLETFQALPTALRARLAPSPETPIRRRRITVWVGVAASLAALVAAWLGLRFGAGRPVERSQAPSTIAVPATASALAAWARITPPHYEAPSLRGSGWESSEFEAAMQRYVVSDYPSAAAGLERAVRRHPDDAAALFFLGACDLLIDRTPDGIRRLQEVVALGESPYVEEAHILLAKGLVREGRVDEAAAELQKALALRGDLEDEARQGLRRIRESRPRGE